jgi:WD40 repeat protein
MSPASHWKIACFVLTALCYASLCQAQEWSPDGKQIAVGGPSLTLLDATAPTTASAAPTPAAAPPSPIPNIANAAFPVWSPDDKTIALLLNGKILTLLDVATQKQTTVDQNAVGAVGWAPDSKTFAYVAQDETGALLLHPAYRDGGSQLPPIPLPCKTLATTCRPVAWVPHTDNMIVAGGDPGKIDLYLIDQGQVTQLTKTGDILSFVVAADGSRVLWARRSPNTHYILLSLHELKLDARTERKLPFPNTVPEVNPQPRRSVDAITSLVFAPDMIHFTFVTQGGPNVGADESQLWLSDITGKSAVPIGRGHARKTPQAADAPPPPADATGITLPAFLPTFSPDSAQLAFLDWTDNKRSLQIATVAAPQTPRLLPLSDTP